MELEQEYLIKSTANQNHLDPDSPDTSYENAASFSNRFHLKNNDAAEQTVKDSPKIENQKETIAKGAKAKSDGSSDKPKDEPLKGSLQIDAFLFREKLTTSQLSRLAYLQEQIVNLRRLELKLESKAGVGTAEEREKLIAKETERMKSEFDNGVFGGETRYLYKQVLRFLEKQFAAQKENRGLRLEDKQELDTLPKLSLDLGKAGNEIGLNPYLLPSDSDLNKLDKACLRFLDETLPSIIDNRLSTIIDKNKFPQAWKDRSGNPAEKRERAEELLRLASLTQEYVKAMHYLNKAGGNFPIDFPAGAKIDFEESGEIQTVNLPLPPTLAKGSREEKVLKDWINSHESLFLQVSEELERGILDGPLAIAEIPGKGIVSDTKYTGEDREYNLRTTDYRVCKKDGLIHITPSTRFWSVPFLSIHNTRKNEVIEATEEEARVYNPADFVEVLRDGKVELIRASDLAQVHDKDISSRNFWKGATITADLAMSLAMILTGTAELAAAYRSCRYLAGLGQISRAAAGASILIENEGAKEYKLGRAASNFRHFLFAAESGYSLYNFYRRAGAVVKTAENVAAASSATRESGETLGFMARTLASGDAVGKSIFMYTGLPLSLQIVYSGTEKWSQRLREQLNGKHDPCSGGLRALDKADSYRR